SQFLNNIKQYQIPFEFIGLDPLYDQLPRSTLAGREKFLSELADAIVIFPENLDSVAELGLFTGHGELIKKMMIAMPPIDNSFIHKELMQTVNAKSSFGSVMIKNKSDFKEILEKLETTL